MSKFVQYFKFMLDKFFGAKYRRGGSCKQCGQCCRNIMFKAGEKYITTENEFSALKNWQKRYEKFYITSKDEEGRLLFTCKSLAEDNKCSSYKKRSLYCRAYPFVNKVFIRSGGQTLEGCGYYYSVSKKFEEFL